MGSSSSKKAKEEKKNKEKEKQSIKKQDNNIKEHSIKEEDSYTPEIQPKNQPKLLKKFQEEKMKFQSKRSVCKIISQKGSGTGFFCKIPNFEGNKELKTLMTNNHVLNLEDIAPDKKIKLTLDDCSVSKIITIDTKRKVYTNGKYDITIIEIKETDNLSYVNYLEVDNIINKPIEDKSFKNFDIYVMHYPGGTEVLYNTGVIQSAEIEGKCTVNHLCATKFGSSGSPLCNLSSFKVLAIHKGGHKTKDINVGTMLKKPIDELIEFNKKDILGNYESLKINYMKLENKNENKEEEEKENRIIINFNINNNDIKNEIYFLNKDEKYNTELNEKVVKLYIDGEKKSFKKYFVPEHNKEYKIKLVFRKLITNCSYMFFNCEKIKSINLSSFNMEEVTNMNHMFGRCYYVKEIELNNCNTKNVTDMSYMFSKCKNLLNIDLQFFDTDKVKTMSCMFNECYNLSNCRLPFFNTENVEDMSNMFNKCYKLQKLNLSSFNTKNVKDMSQMFNDCVELETLVTEPEFFNTYNANNMAHLFRCCNNLKNMDSLKFNTKNVKYLSYMFYECLNLKNIDLSKFSTKDLIDMTYMFGGCKNLTKIDFSTFIFKNIKQMNDIFDDCENLKEIKINKEWKDIFQEQNKNLNQSIKITF